MAYSSELCLHVGYGKTGSTFLQKWLASQAKPLEAAGIRYPIPATGLGDSGNGQLLLEALAVPSAPPPWVPAESSGTLLFSREHLARELSAAGACERLAAWALRWQLGPVKVLLLVRDPQEHSYSLWAQKVKRAGERRTLEAFRESYDGTRMATRFLQESQAAGMKVSVRNYGLWRQELLELLLQWLGLDGAQLAELRHSGLGAADTLLVNPTPGYRQLRLQRRLNALRPELLRGRPQVPPHWLAQLLPAKPPAPLKEELLSRWLEEIQAFNVVAAASGEDAEPMATYGVAGSKQCRLPSQPWC
jgi:hypothetical protein